MNTFEHLMLIVSKMDELGYTADDKYDKLGVYDYDQVPTFDTPEKEIEWIMDKTETPEEVFEEVHWDIEDGNLGWLLGESNHEEDEEDEAYS